MLFGLSMDYEVFFVSRMREEWDKHGDNERAVAVGLAKTGRLVTAASMIMFAAFMGLRRWLDTRSAAVRLWVGRSDSHRRDHRARAAPAERDEDLRPLEPDGCRRASRDWSGLSPRRCRAHGAAVRSATGTTELEPGPHLVDRDDLCVDQPVVECESEDDVLCDVGIYARGALGPGNPEHPLREDRSAQRRHAKAESVRARKEREDDVRSAANVGTYLDLRGKRRQPVWRPFRRIKKRENVAGRHAQLRGKRFAGVAKLLAVGHVASVLACRLQLSVGLTSWRGARAQRGALRGVWRVAGP